MEKQEMYINKFKEVHGDTYDYSKFEFTRAKDKSIIICREHGEFLQRPQNHSKGEGCPKCGKLKARSKKTLYEFIAQSKIKHGDLYDYSKVKYTEAQDKVIIICPTHGEFLQEANSHLRGRGCPKCSYISRGDSKRMVSEEVKTKVEEAIDGEYGIDLDSLNTYKNVDTVFSLICPTHGKFPTSVRKLIYNSNRCPKCSLDRVSDINRKTPDEFINEAKGIHGDKYNYDNVIYLNAHTKVAIKCNTHNSDFLQTPNQHLKGQGCPKCSNQTSKAELEINEFLIENGLNTIIRDRSILNGKEIDIFLPDFNIGIEYNGLIWHSEKFNKGENVHLDKTLLAKSKGVTLLQIFEDEWQNKKDIIKSMLLNKVGMSSKIYARKCKVVELSNKDVAEFMEKNHLKGMANANITVGLKYQDMLVAVMSFSKPRVNLGQKGSKPGEYELLRYVNVLNHTVIGGASKLLKYFEKNFHPTKIFTYSDRRYSEGNMYSKIGFEFLGETRPGYFYTRNGQFRENRFKFRKSELVKQGGNPNLSERDIMIGKGYYRIYDCGNNKFEKNYDD